MAKGKKNKSKEIESHKKIQGLIIAENIDGSPFNYFFDQAPIEHPLEKSIQLFERSEIKEIFVFASKNKEKVAEYLAQRKTRNEKQIKLLATESVDNLGDILRSVFEMKVINNDFVLLIGNIVSGLDLNSIVKEYEQVKKRDKTILMLKSFYQCENNLPTTFTDQSFVMFNKENKEIKFYEGIKNMGKALKLKENHRFKFKSFFKEETMTDYEMRFDLADCGLSVCSLDVLNFFHENFDFHNERDDFLKDVLSSEISEDKIIIHIQPTDLFFEKVNNPYRLYRSSIKTIKGCFDNFFINKEIYNFSKFNRIISKKAHVANTAIIKDNIYLGSEVVVGENTVIENSIILEGSVVGKDCKIVNSYITKGCVIEDGCEVVNSVITQERLNVKESLTYKYTLENEFKDYSEEIADFSDSDSYNLESDEEGEFENNDFDNEVKETIFKLDAESSNIEKIGIELMNLRLAENKSHSDFLESILKHLLNKIGEKQKDKISFVKELEKSLKLINKFILGVKEMQTAVNAIQDFCNKFESNVFYLIMQLLYMKEVIKEEIVLGWYDENKDSTDPKTASYVDSMERFVEWIKAEEEESDEEDSEEEEESEEESEEDDN